MFVQVLGPDKGELNEMHQRVLKANGNLVPLCTLRSIHMSELHSKTDVKKHGRFD